MNNVTKNNDDNDCVHDHFSFIALGCPFDFVNQYGPALESGRAT